MTCDSCGAEASGLEAVHRRYVMPPDRDGGHTPRVLPDVEHWCFACLTHYPHEPA